jgi:hypothetical protein
MKVDWKYTLFTTVLLGILGGLVFFVWDLINNSFSYPHASNQAVHAAVIFTFIGFVIGILIGDRK